MFLNFKLVTGPNHRFSEVSQLCIVDLKANIDGVRHDDFLDFPYKS